MSRRASRSVYCGVAGDAAPPRRSAGFTPRTPEMCSSAFIDARVRPDSSIEMYALVYCGSATCAWVRPLAVRSERIRAPTSATIGDRTSATARALYGGEVDTSIRSLPSSFGPRPGHCRSGSYGPSLARISVGQRVCAARGQLAETATTRVRATGVGNGCE